MWPFGTGAISGCLKGLRLKKKDVEMNKEHAMSQEQRLRATYTDAFAAPCSLSLIRNQPHLRFGQEGQPRHMSGK